MRVDIWIKQSLGKELFLFFKLNFKKNKKTVINVILFEV